MKMSKPFSIIIPTLNEASGIESCLLALQSLRTECELIVVDGGSADKTTQLAAPLADKTVSSVPGRARQMNMGTQQATGDVLIFLHADTYLPEQALALIAARLAGGQQWGRFDVQLRGQHFMLPIIAFMMNWRSRLTGIATGDQVMFVQRAAFAAVSGFPDIALMEDIMLSKALKKISNPVCLSAKASSSGRRWERYGVFHTILMMWWLRGCFACGADPNKLAAIYAQGWLWKRG
jgi:rSAM/selenodomain-associated transferase 2